MHLCMHLTVESFMNPNCMSSISICCRIRCSKILSTTFIACSNNLTPLYDPHSIGYFIPGLKPSFSANPSHCSLPFFFRIDCMYSPRLFTVTSEHICFLLFSFFVLHFLVVGSVRYIKLAHVGFRAHVKIVLVSHIVSYRIMSSVL